jgi:hypothetical protein
MRRAVTSLAPQGRAGFIPSHAMPLCYISLDAQLMCKACVLTLSCCLLERCVLTMGSWSAIASISHVLC